MAGEEFKGAWGNPNMGPTFYEEIPEIENFCRFDFYSNQLMWADPESKYMENNVMLADSTLKLECVSTGEHGIIVNSNIIN